MKFFALCIKPAFKDFNLISILMIFLILLLQKKCCQKKKIPKQSLGNCHSFFFILNVLIILFDSFQIIAIQSFFP